MMGSPSPGSPSPVSPPPLSSRSEPDEIKPSTAEGAGGGASGSIMNCEGSAADSNPSSGETSTSWSDRSNAGSTSPTEGLRSRPGIDPESKSRVGNDSGVFSSRSGNGSMSGSCSNSGDGCWCGGVGGRFGACGARAVLSNPSILGLGFCGDPPTSRNTRPPASPLTGVLDRRGSTLGSRLRIRCTVAAASAVRPSASSDSWRICSCSIASAVFPALAS